jgi:ribosome-binding ATPase
MLHIGNKVDDTSETLIKRLSEAGIHFASGASELALRNAAAANVITYHPGDPAFLINKEEALSAGQKAGLARIRSVMDRFGGTGVQQALNALVFGELDMIVVYPVEDENHFTDGKNRVLPDAFLMRKGSTPHDLAYQVHTDIGKGFLYAIDARKKMRIKESHVLADGDIIKIVSTAK